MDMSGSRDGSKKNRQEILEQSRKERAGRLLAKQKVLIIYTPGKSCTHLHTHICTCNQVVAATRIQSLVRGSRSRTQVKPL
jgi:hypothetical protein